LGDALSILQLFSAAGNTPPPGLSPWDQGFIKALYHTEHTNRGQLGEIKKFVVKDLTPYFTYPTRIVTYSGDPSPRAPASDALLA
jgi:hypothetical protein